MKLKILIAVIAVCLTVALVFRTLRYSEENSEYMIEIGVVENCTEDFCGGN